MPSFSHHAKRLAYKVAAETKAKLHSLVRPNVLSGYLLQAPPNAADTLSIFKGEWVSRLSPPFPAGTAGGDIGLYDDERIKQADHDMGGFEGKTVIELGPLEGGHTYMMIRRGAKSVVGVEANTRFYLKCLVVKELLEMTNVKYLCGDFVGYLRESGQTFDVCLASGVLYHMRNPVELLSLICQSARQVYLWTHYYDEAVISKNPHLASRFIAPVVQEYGGFKHSLHQQSYRSGIYNSKFCGGTASYSRWLPREEILGALRHFGMRIVSTSHEILDNPAGPSFSVMAEKV